METPIVDFVQGYARSGVSRLHMPGHKGRGNLGCEGLDITEIQGADSLYEAEGIIARSEANASALFRCPTFYAAGGSSQCLKAMVHLAVQATGRRTVLAARNVHQSFLHAAALLDLRVAWLWPEPYQLLSCPVTAEGLERALDGLAEPPAAVFLTSPDYLGRLQPIASLAAVCRRRGVLLLVDGAHGAYLPFLPPSLHPAALGADLCCASAHKTLPVLTGGAYLHLGRDFTPPGGTGAVRQALSLFGSTSPSYLILQSLDLCNAWLAGEGPAAFQETAERVAGLKETLRCRGWTLTGEEPLKLTLRCRGTELLQALRRQGVEGEYADREHLVLMFSPGNGAEDYRRLTRCLLDMPPMPPEEGCPAMARPRAVLSIREALLGRAEIIPAAEAAGRICAAPTVSCPPAVPVAVSGERMEADAAAVFAHYGVSWVMAAAEGRP